MDCRFKKKKKRGNLRRQTLQKPQVVLDQAYLVQAYSCRTRFKEEDDIIHSSNHPLLDPTFEPKPKPFHFGSLSGPEQYDVIGNNIGESI